MMTDTTLKAIYKANDFTNGHYIIGTHESGTVYAHICNNFHFVDLAHADVTSAKSGNRSTCLKYRQTSAKVLAIREHATVSFPLCSVDFLERVAKAYGKRPNRGKAFERIITEYFGQAWEDDRLEWWLGGDIVLDGQAYQIKYDKCQFTNESQVRLNGLEG